MLTIIIQVNAPPWQSDGIKEDLAMYVERYGDTRVISIEQTRQPRMEQMTIGGKNHVERQVPRVRRRN